MWAISELSGWNASGMNVWNPPVLVLELTQPDHVIDPVLGAINMAVKHGGVGMEAEPVRRAMDIEPAFGRSLGATDLLADFRVKDFGTAAGQAAEPGLDQLVEHLLDRLARDFTKPLDLHGRIRLDMDFGSRLADPVHDVDVISKRQLMVQASHDVQLGRPAGTGLRRALDDLAAIHHVSPVFAQIGPECAEVASVDADVGWIDVGVHVEVREVAVIALADEVGHRTQSEEVIRRLHGQAIFKA